MRLDAYILPPHHAFHAAHSLLHPVRRPDDAFAPAERIEECVRCDREAPRCDQTPRLSFAEFLVRENLRIARERSLAACDKSCGHAAEPRRAPEPPKPSSDLAPPKLGDAPAPEEPAPSARLQQVYTTLARGSVGDFIDIFM